MSEELCAMSAVALRDAIRRHEVSPVEVTRAVLERAHELQPALNCFITLCDEQALDDARAAEKAMMRGDAQGLLLGVPYTCKDIVNTHGVRTTFGSLLHEDNIPEADAEIVARMRRHGAILIGKTTTPEFGAKCLTDAPLFGRTRNAWSAQHTSGGSSGGAAVALAAGIAPLAIATDGGGSTRIPAACNGVVGLKQSLGLVPHSQVQDAFANQTYVTPMTRDVADTALMLDAICGAHDSDPWSIRPAPPAFLEGLQYGEDLRGRRFLHCAAPPGRPVSGAVRSAFESALRCLRSLGADTDDFDGAGFDVEPIWRTINHTVWRARFSALARDHADRMSPSLIRQLATASEVSGIDYQRAMFARTELYRHVQRLLSDHDFIVMPTLSRTALPIDQDLFGTLEIDGNSYDDLRSNWFPWTMPFNLTGHPAITLSCGADSAGLPIGLQIVGRLGDDLELLRVAARFEAAQAPAANRLSTATGKD